VFERYWASPLARPAAQVSAAGERGGLAGLLPALAAAAAPLGAEADFLREYTAPFGIVGSNHRIIGRQSPLRAIIIRRHAIMRHKVTLEHFQLLTVVQTDDEVTLYRVTDRNGWFQSCFWDNCGAGNSRQRCVHVRD
jgi:hypothetical protein